jgi:predicted secreted hydrolase
VTKAHTNSTREQAARENAARKDLAQLLWMDEFYTVHLPTALAQQLAGDKNSPAAWGARMRRFLEHLIEHPVPRARNDAEAYRAMLPHCDALSPLQVCAMRSLLPRSSNQGYEPVPAVSDLRFPRDHALKLRSQVGWHFIVGSCWDSDGREYGIEVMFFGGAVFPPELAHAYGLSDLDNQVLELQLAVSIAGLRHHQAKPLVALGTSGLVEASDSPFSLKLGSNLLASQSSDQLFPLHVRARGLCEGETPPHLLEVDLMFTSGKEFLAQGDAGAMPSLDGIGSLYYSIPNMQIDPEASRLRIGEQEVKLVRGLFWFDHQWGSLGMNQSEIMRAADNIVQPGPVGWDWFEAQFADDRQLTMFVPHLRKYADAFYGRVGAQPPTGMHVRVAGKFMAGDKSTRIVHGTLTVTDWFKATGSSSPERYPPTDTWHPNRWEFVLDEMPEELRRFTMIPIVDTGQPTFFANGAQISEGAVKLLNRDGEDIGRGFAEAVGYADTRRNTLRLAGLPVTDEMLERLERRPPPLTARLSNMLYVLTHRKRLRERLAAAKGLEFFVEDPGQYGPKGDD